jgi:hypothetical protein
MGVADEFDQAELASDVRAELEQRRHELEVLHHELHGQSHVTLLW